MILREVWNLPRNSHTGILHCVAQVLTISNLLYKRFLSLYSHALSSSFLVRSIFLNSSQLVYTFSGYNYVYGHQHFRVFSNNDFDSASTIGNFRRFYGLYSLCEDIISCD